MRVFVGLVVLGLVAKGDTIRLTNGSSWNGKVTFQGTTFTVKPVEGVPQSILAQWVERVEVNSLNSNSNPPPDLPSPRQEKNQAIRCRVNAKKNHTESGTLEGITPEGQVIVVTAEHGRTTLKRDEVESLDIIP